MPETGKPEVHPLQDEEAAPLREMLAQAFGNTLDHNERWMEGIGKENVRTVHVNGRLAGGLASIPMGQWFGGRSIPMGGIAGVVVAPEFRGRGAASALMRSILEELHENGTPLSSLFPSAPPVYRKAGYEFGGSRFSYIVPLNDMPRAGGAMEIEPIEPEDFQAIKRAYAKRAALSSGHLDRHPSIWKNILEPPGAAPRRYLIRRNGEVEGYVCLTQDRDREGRRQIRASDLCGLTIKARLGLLSFLGGHRSTAHSAQWFGGHPDPFIDLIPTHVSQIHPGNWMLRIVDIVGALEQRGYPKNITAELHLEIEDDWLEWNNGRFTLEVSDGKASVRQGGEGRLPLNIRTFAGLYTGRLYSDDLKLNNAINARDGEIDVAAQVFGGPRPWMPDGF